MTEHVYLATKDSPIPWPIDRKVTFCQVHFPPVGNTQLVHIYHKERNTWVYLSFYLLDVSSNN